MAHRQFGSFAVLLAIEVGIGLPRMNSRLLRSCWKWSSVDNIIVASSGAPHLRLRGSSAGAWRCDNAW